MRLNQEFVIQPILPITSLMKRLLLFYLQINLLEIVVSLEPRMEGQNIASFSWDKLNAKIRIAPTCTNSALIQLRLLHRDRTRMRHLKNNFLFSARNWPFRFQVFVKWQSKISSSDLELIKTQLSSIHNPLSSHHQKKYMRKNHYLKTMVILWKCLCQSLI